MHHTGTHIRPLTARAWRRRVIVAGIDGILWLAMLLTMAMLCGAACRLF